jgi:hypothetical protein
MISIFAKSKMTFTLQNTSHMRVWIMFMVEDHTMTMECKATISVIKK